MLDAFTSGQSPERGHGQMGACLIPVNQQGKPPFQFTLKSVFGLMAAVGVVLLIAPAGRNSVLFGPLTIVVRMHDPFAWLMTIVLVVAMASFPMRPNPLTALLAFLAALAWLFLGVVGISSEC